MGEFVENYSAAVVEVFFVAVDFSEERIVKDDKPAPVYDRRRGNFGNFVAVAGDERFVEDKVYAPAEAFENFRVGFAQAFN